MALLVLWQAITVAADIPMWLLPSTKAIVVATWQSGFSLLYHTARLWDSQPAERPQLKALVALAKAPAATNAVAAVDQAMLIVGGQALTPDLPLERLSRDVRAGLFHPPTLDAALIGLGAALVSD